MSNGLICYDVIFNPKSVAVPYNYRISYKVSLICIIIGKCCGKKGCSAIKLQMISSAVSTLNGRNELLSLINQTLTINMTLIRFDPAISRAINYAMVEELIYRQGNGLFRLTEKGKQLVDWIYKQNEVMVIEKAFFQELSSKLTEEIIEKISFEWGASYVKNKQS